MYLSPEHGHDVLISYSHGDINATGQSELKAWSHRFANALENELRLELKFRNVSIVVDEHPRAENSLDRSLPLTQQLRCKVQTAAMFMILMSPHYLTEP